MSQGNFSEYELNLLAKLPFDIAMLANQYRSDVLNAAEFWEEPPYPPLHVPKIIEIYYGDTESSDVLIINGELRDYRVRNLDLSTNSISVLIDDQWAYIQIEGREILNRLGGVILPEVIIKAEKLCQSVLGVTNHG